MDLAARLGGSAFLVSENLLYLPYRVLQRYLTLCKYCFLVVYTLFLFVFKSKCLFGRR